MVRFDMPRLVAFYSSCVEFMSAKIGHHQISLNHFILVVYFILFSQNISHLLELFSYIGKRYFETLCDFLFSLVCSCTFENWFLKSVIFIPVDLKVTQDVWGVWDVTSNILRIVLTQMCHSNISMQMHSMLWVFFKQCSFSMFNHLSFEWGCVLIYS